MKFYRNFTRMFLNIWKVVEISPLIIVKINVKENSNKSIHSHKISSLNTCNGAVDSQVKSNARNNLIMDNIVVLKVIMPRDLMAGHKGEGHKCLYGTIKEKK